MLGSPLGSQEFVSIFVRTALEEDTRDLDMLPRLDVPLVNFWLLTTVFAQRPSHLTRVSPSIIDIVAQLEGYDTRIGSVRGLGELESSTSESAWREAL